MTSRTFSLAVDLAGVEGSASCLLLLFLALSTLVEVLDDDADEHVEYEEGDEQQERDEVEQSPLVVVRHRLQAYNQPTIRGLSLYHNCDSNTKRPYRDAFDCDESDRNYDMRSIQLRYDYDTTTTTN